MTDQHRATPEQWADAGAFASDTRACILELLARLEALEAQYETQRLATLSWGKDVDKHSRWIDDHLKRIMALEAGQRPNASPAPADSLVERVARAIRAERAFFDEPADWYDEARAAIREVAAALIDWHDSDQVVRTAWEAGKWLEQQANK